MIKIKRLALRLKHALIHIEKLIAISSLFLLLALILIQLIARNVFNSGFPELDIIARHLVLFILFTGAALIFESNKHIKIDILSTMLSEKAKQNISAPLLFITSLICFTFSWYSAAFWMDEYNFAPANEKMSVYLALVLPIGFIVLGLHSLMLTIAGYDDKPVIEKK